MSSHHHVPSFLELPHELRFLIYNHVYKASVSEITRGYGDSGAHFVFATSRKNDVCAKYAPHPFLHVSKHIRNESARLFYELATFRIVDGCAIGGQKLSFPVPTCLTKRIRKLEIRPCDLSLLNIHFPTLLALRKPGNARRSIEIEDFANLTMLTIPWQMSSEDDFDYGFAHDIGLLRCLVFFRKNFALHVRFSQYCTWLEEIVILRGEFDSVSGLQVKTVHETIVPRIQEWERLLKFALCLDGHGDLFNASEGIQASAFSGAGARMWAGMWAVIQTYKERMAIDRVTRKDHRAARAMIAKERQADFEKSWRKHFPASTKQNPKVVTGD